MATLTTQSIGVIGTQIAASQFQANQVRATEVAQLAAVQRQNHPSATKSSNKASEDKKRSVDPDAVEGAFASQETAGDGASSGTNKLNKTA
jgi:hypothetical protein